MSFSKKSYSLALIVLLSATPLVGQDLAVRGETIFPVSMRRDRV